MVRRSALSEYEWMVVREYPRRTNKRTMRWDRVSVMYVTAEPAQTEELNEGDGEFGVGRVREDV